MPFRRTWLQFSLRTLLLFMLGASLVMAWVARMRIDSAEQRKAYQLIIDKHGASNINPESARSPWLQWLLGADITQGNCIEIGNSDLSDADLAQLTSLRQLRRLSLHRTRVTDRGLVHLQKLPHLRYLSLDETEITDAGLPSLHPCHSLEFLSLSHTRTTPTAARRLQTALPHLNIIDTNETDLPPVKEKKKENDQ